jgi:hypothetical protein
MTAKKYTIAATIVRHGLDGEKPPFKFGLDRSVKWQVFDAACPNIYLQLADWSI